MIKLENTKVSMIDTDDCGYNGTIAVFGDQYIIFYRCGGTRKQSRGGFLHFPHRLKFCVLDSEFVPISINSIVDTGINCEDPRIIKVNDGYKLFTYKNRRVVTQEFRPGIDGNGGLSLSMSESIELKPLNFQMNTWEKNWVPFEYNGTIHLIYNTQPFVVLKMSDKGDCWVIHNQEYDLGWSHGQIRGGTPAVRISDDEFLTFFHSSTSRLTGESADWREPRNYYVGAYTFKAKPPFKISRITKEPLTWDGLLKTYTPSCHHKVVFPSGLLVDEGKLIMSYGENDNWNFVLETPLDDVLNTMQSI